MAPSMFTRPSVVSDNKGSTALHRQKFRSISSFFHSTTTTSVEDNELHVIAYFQPQDNSPAHPTYDGLPSIRNASAISLSRAIPSPSQSTASFRLKAEIHKENVGVSYTSHTLQAQVSREMPTLASAIHIPDSTTSTKTFKPQHSTLPSPGNNAVHPLYHINASSTSIFDSYVHVAETVEKDHSNEDSENTLRRKLSRRLSLDLIVPKLTGSLRKRERSGSKSSTFDKDNVDSSRRWSLFNNSENKATQIEAKPFPVPPVNKMQAGMPVTRNWRNKFTVHKPSTELLGDKKEDIGSRLEASRQARERTMADSISTTERYDERTIKRIPVKRMEDRSSSDIQAKCVEDKLRQRQSLISMKASTMKDCQDASRFSFVHRPSSIASTFDPAATPKSTASSIPIPFVPTGPPLIESQTVTSLSATFDSPSPLPRPLHTPSTRSNGLHVPQTTKMSIFSPAQDDRSILDPGRSPCPLPDGSPLIPSDGLRYQHMPLPDPPIQQNLTSSPSASGIGGRKDVLSASESAVSMAISATQPSQTGTFGVTKNHNTSHTNLEGSATSTDRSHMTSSSSSRTIYTLPRSKSKSHTDLSTYASSKNLVDHIEATQGPGWWSADKRASRKESVATTQEEVEQKTIERLERLAQSTNLPHRTKFDGQECQVDTDHLLNTSLNRMRAEDKMRTRSSMDLGSSYRATGHQARHSLVAGSIWSKDQSSSPRRSVLTNQSRILDAAGTPVKIVHLALIPLPPSEIKKGTFVSNRISPEIARRASFLNKSAVNTAITDDNSSDSPSRSTSRQTTRTVGSIISNVSTVPTSLQSDGEAEDDKLSNGNQGVKIQQLIVEYEEKLKNMKSRHALEVDTILNALSQSKNDNQLLKTDNDRLFVENNKLKEKVKILCMSLQSIELGSSTEQCDQPRLTDNQISMKRSESTMSSLLPELNSTNSMQLSPLPYTSRTSSLGSSSDQYEIDEFGRKNLSTSKSSMKNDRKTSDFSGGEKTVLVMEKRNVSGQSYTTEGSIISYEDHQTQQISDIVNEGWTLSLKEDDKRFLNDL
ncbi:uncharacterized protein I206_107806 [Kwoniella pini CBS 10737]|uniref:Uncharacterized protein n=1 Tax=Kwoniella pini CBS 10737 TaxID=1296096 RepID=A0A1B9HYE7_9TREE|nr:uncharacterized protein I206_06139 [Kwoniella pini CBS 10737]OCF48271.1 hypothetical protein I206_06139 [Kwoniella pini CBS 10737]